jgi:PleD family two-component response regulator
VDNRAAGEVERSATADKLLYEAKEPGRNKIAFSV